jgi:hypothetical protein
MRSSSACPEPLFALRAGFPDLGALRFGSQGEEHPTEDRVICAHA